MAWLRAPIDPPKRAKDQTPLPSRAERLGEGVELPLPELEDGYHLVSALMEAGPVSCAGMGLSALSWQEINAWRDATASHLRPHELQLLRRLSGVYLEQFEKSKAEACPAPEIIRAERGDAKKLAARIKNVLRD